MQTILEHIVPEDCITIDYGKMDDFTKRQLVGLAREYEHLAIVDHWYDEETMPYENNWTDVEGMGFGWLWTNYEPEQWHSMMAGLIADRARKLMLNSEQTLFFVYENDVELTYHFVTLSDDPTFRHDTVVVYSHYELEALDLI